MRTLFVIGNGFDLYHGLPTSYSHFNLYVKEVDPELADTLDNYFNLKCNDKYLWCDFENDLASYDNDAFFDAYNQIDVMAESFRRSDCDGLEDELLEESEKLVSKVKEVFTEWIESIEYPEVSDLIMPLLHLGKDSIFINFNYTDTLEVFYDIPKENIKYIHNNAGDFSGELIFGHSQLDDGVDDNTFDENGEPTRTMFTDAQNASRSPFFAFQKDTAAIIDEHLSFFDDLKDIDRIVILGHSLSVVDWPYFKVIAERCPSATWEVSYHGDAGIKREQTYNMLDNHPPLRMITFKDLTL